MTVPPLPVLLLLLRTVLVASSSPSPTPRTRLPNVFDLVLNLPAHKQRRPEVLNPSDGLDQYWGEQVAPVPDLSDLFVPGPHPPQPDQLTMEDFPEDDYPEVVMIPASYVAPPEQPQTKNITINLQLNVEMNKIEPPKGEKKDSKKKKKKKNEDSKEPNSDIEDSVEPRASKTSSEDAKDGKNKKSKAKPKSKDDNRLVSLVDEDNDDEDIEAYSTETEADPDIIDGGSPVRPGVRPDDEEAYSTELEEEPDEDISGASPVRPVVKPDDEEAYSTELEEDADEDISGASPLRPGVKPDVEEAYSTELDEDISAASPVRPEVQPDYEEPDEDVSGASPIRPSNSMESSEKTSTATIQQAITALSTDSLENVTEKTETGRDLIVSTIVYVTTDKMTATDEETTSAVTVTTEPPVEDGDLSGTRPPKEQLKKVVEKVKKQTNRQTNRKTQFIKHTIDDSKELDLPDVNITVVPKINSTKTENPNEIVWKGNFSQVVEMNKTNDQILTSHIKVDKGSGKESGKTSTTLEVISNFEDVVTETTTEFTTTEPTPTATTTIKTKTTTTTTTTTTTPKKVRKEKFRKKNRKLRSRNHVPATTRTPPKLPKISPISQTFPPTPNISHLVNLPQIQYASTANTGTNGQAPSPTNLQSNSQMVLDFLDDYSGKRVGGVAGEPNSNSCFTRDRERKGTKAEGLNLLKMRGRYVIRIKEFEDCKKHIEEMWRAGKWQGEEGCGLVLVGSSSCPYPHCCSCTVSKNNSCALVSSVKDSWNINENKEFINKFRVRFKNSITLGSPEECNYLKDKLKGITKAEVLANVNKLRCEEKVEERTGNRPQQHKYEIFFLAKYLLNSKRCTIEIKVLRNGATCVMAS